MLSHAAAIKVGAGHARTCPAPVSKSPRDSLRRNPTLSSYHNGLPPQAAQAAGAIAVPEAAAARMLSLSPRTLWGLRRNGRGPRYAQIGGSIRYSVAELHRWLDEKISSADGGAT